MKLGLCLPHLGQFPGATLQCFLEYQPLGVDELSLFRIPRKPVDIARNEAARMALEAGCERTLWIDSDMTWRPQALHRLMARMDDGLDFASGMIFLRQWPTMPAWGTHSGQQNGTHMYHFDTEGVLETIAKYRIDKEWYNEFVLPRDDDDLRAADGCGMAFCMINTDVFRAIEPPWFKSTASVGGGEDFYFSRRMKEAGFEIWVDRGIGIGHLFSDEQSVGISDFGWTTSLIAQNPDYELELDVGRAPDEEEAYGPTYYKRTFGEDYTRKGRLFKVFFDIAERIHADFPDAQRTLDAGCAKGFLVEHLLAFGVDASGFDISDFALSKVRGDLDGRVWKQSITEPIQGQYDLVTCIEVVEHLRDLDGATAIKNLCAATDQVLFSSTDSDHDDPTHQNVQPAEYWDALFRTQGFERQDYDASYISPVAVLYGRA